MEYAHGGIILAVKNSIFLEQIPIHSNLEALVVFLKFKDRSISVCYLYLPPNLTLHKEDILTLI